MAPTTLMVLLTLTTLTILTSLTILMALKVLTVLTVLTTLMTLTAESLLSVSYYYPFYTVHAHICIRERFYQHCPLFERFFYHSQIYVWQYPGLYQRRRFPPRKDNQSEWVSIRDTAHIRVYTGMFPRYMYRYIPQVYVQVRPTCLWLVTPVAMQHIQRWGWAK